MKSLDILEEISVIFQTAAFRSAYRSRKQSVVTQKKEICLLCQRLRFENPPSFKPRQKDYLLSQVALRKSTLAKPPHPPAKVLESISSLFGSSLSLPFKQTQTRTRTLSLKKAQKAPHPPHSPLSDIPIISLPIALHLAAPAPSSSLLSSYLGEGEGRGLGREEGL